MLDCRRWYFENVFYAEEDFYKKLPVSTLDQMYLPIIPKDLKDIIEVRWKGKNKSAISAFDAYLDINSIPVINLRLKYKKTYIEEEYPYHVAHREAETMIELARELKNGQ